jgi:hypothetical protein
MRPHGAQAGSGTVLLRVWVAPYRRDDRRGDQVGVRQWPSEAIASLVVRLAPGEELSTALDSPGH